MERMLLILWLERHAAALQEAIEFAEEFLVGPTIRTRVWRQNPNPFDLTLNLGRPLMPPEDAPEDTWEWHEVQGVHEGIAPLYTELERLHGEIEALRKG
jgi:hypothetical protein